MKNYKLKWGFIFGLLGGVITLAISFVVVFILGMVSFFHGMRGDQKAELLWNNIANAAIYLALFFIVVTIITAVFRGMKYGKNLELANNHETGRD